VILPRLQFATALAEIDRQLALKFLELSDLAPHCSQLRRQQIADLMARLLMVIPQFEKLADFVQRESKTLHIGDEAQTDYVSAAVEPVPAQRAGSFGKQSAAFIETDRVHGECGPPSHFTNLHRAGRMT
jgi:hypothetical protein